MQALRDENATLKQRTVAFDVLFRGLSSSKRGRSPTSLATTPDPKRQKPDALSVVHVDLAAPAPAPTEERGDGGADPPQPQQPNQTKRNGTPPPNDAEEDQLLEEVDELL